MSPDAHEFLTNPPSWDDQDVWHPHVLWPHVQWVRGGNLSDQSVAHLKCAGSTLFAPSAGSSFAGPKRLVYYAPHALHCFVLRSAHAGAPAIGFAGEERVLARAAAGNGRALPVQDSPAERQLTITERYAGELAARRVPASVHAAARRTVCIAGALQARVNVVGIVAIEAIETRAVVATRSLARRAVLAHRAVGCTRAGLSRCPAALEANVFDAADLHDIAARTRTAAARRLTAVAAERRWSAADIGAVHPAGPSSRCASRCTTGSRGATRRCRTSRPRAARRVAAAVRPEKQSTDCGRHESDPKPGLQPRLLRKRTPSESTTFGEFRRLTEVPNASAVSPAPAR